MIVHEIRCDKCKIQLHNGKEKGVFQGRINGDMDVVQHTLRQIHLCPVCADLFDKWCKGIDE